MIKGERKKDLTVPAVLALISEFDIYKRYIQDNWHVNQVFSSPLRKDENPSWIVGNRSGSLKYHDFATGESGDAFDFMKRMFNLETIDEVLRKIDNDFCLGFNSSSVTGEQKKIEKYEQPEEQGKRYSLIQVTTKKFTKEELKYWSEYFIDISDLRAENVYSIKEVYLNKQKLCFNPIELRFGYLYLGQYWKIYSPLAKKKDKWLSNVPLSLCHGLNNLQKDKNSLIQKSMKDFLVCRKIFPYVCHVQNESVAAFSEETVKYIKENSEIAYYSGDSDSVGKSASYIITEKFGFKHINSPDRLLPEINDMADWARAESLQALEEHFKIKKLIL